MVVQGWNDWYWVLLAGLPILGVIGTATAALMAVGAAASTAGSVYGAKKQSQAAKDAAASQERSNAEALAMERENEMRRREEWDKTQAENRRQWEIAYGTDASRYRDLRGDTNKGTARDMAQYLAYNERMRPYRAVSQASLADLAKRANLNVAVVPHSNPAYIPPAGWTEGQLSPQNPAATEAAYLADLARIQQGRA